LVGQYRCAADSVSVATTVPTTTLFSTRERTTRMAEKEPHE
jgi:hypothetical protein